MVKLHEPVMWECNFFNYNTFNEIYLREHCTEVKLYPISVHSSFNYVSYNIANGIILPWVTLFIW